MKLTGTEAENLHITTMNVLYLLSIYRYTKMRASVVAKKNVLRIGIKY